MITIMAGAKSGGLSKDMLDDLCRRWHGGALHWLDPDRAVEFNVPRPPDDWADTWQKLQNMQVDMVMQPKAGRRKAVLLSDMDSTMIEQECIDELAYAAGVGPHVAHITERAMNGELDFEAALQERVALLKGLPAGIVADIYRDKITLMPGAKALLATMKAHGAYALLVSGGFTAFTQLVARDLGFDAHRANELVMENGVITGTTRPPILGRAAKRDILHEIAVQQGVTPAQIMAVGDGANDLAMLQAAGAGVAFHAKPAVAAQAGMVINHADLTALLFVQGYKESEFVGG